VWDEGRLTYAELEGRARGFARVLAERGTAPGDRIAISFPNSWAFVVALLGALKRGLTVAPLSPQLTAAENERIVADLKPVAVVDRVDVTEAAWDTVEPSTAAIVLYTSGSTGRPKGALLSHAATAWANRSWADMMRLTPDDRVLGVLPFPHSYGLNGALLAPLITGAAVVIVERFSPDAVVAALARHRVTMLPAVATMYSRLLASPALDDADFSSVRFALSGAAPCPWDLAEEWRRRTGVRILRGFGMTELFRPISYTADDPRDFPDAIGRLLPGVEARVVDDEGAPVAPGEIGELWLNTPGVMDGYLDAEDETRAVLVDGWFRTGDLAAITPDRFVRIAGRKKDLILRGGYSIYPQEVEAALLAHPDVLDAAVVGIPHAELGEEVAAFVTLTAGAGATVEALSAWCRGRLAGYKCPRRIDVRDALPRGPTGKILKARLVAGLALPASTTFPTG
jgi:long-chain acyl-CoA synthetase